jgi:hypothetical protein
MAGRTVGSSCFIFPLPRPESSAEVCKAFGGRKCCLLTDLVTSAACALCLPCSCRSHQRSCSTKLPSFHAVSAKFPLFSSSPLQISPSSLGLGLTSNEAMAGHGRRQSRGPIFSFTIDAVRALTRAGSWRGSLVHFERGDTAYTKVQPSAWKMKTSLLPKS